MKLRLGEQVVVIPPELIAQMLATSVPGFLSGTEPCKTGMQGAIKRGLKALMPMMLEGSQALFASLDIPKPDLKSKQARENIIMYGLTYLLAASSYVTNQAEFIVQGVTNSDNEIVVTGVDATLATNQPSQAKQLSDGKQRTINAPASPQES